MKKSAIILTLLALLSPNVHSKAGEYEAAKASTVAFLVSHCAFRDANPTYQAEADTVNLFVAKVFGQQYASGDIPGLITEALRLFYDNSTGVFEDVPDAARMTIRRSLCYMALAFLSDEYRYPAFLSDARESLDKLAPDISAGMPLLVNVVELYRELSGDAPAKEIEYKIALYRDDLKNRAEHISDTDFIAAYDRLLSDVAGSILATEK